jgi:hypothetical protein
VNLTDIDPATLATNAAGGVGTAVALAYYLSGQISGMREEVRALAARVQTLADQVHGIDLRMARREGADEARRKAEAG